ncbi:MAG: lipid-A-disaccharide synthase N-terminal domain-containing protein [Pseudomonadota bacterium]
MVDDWPAIWLAIFGLGAQAIFMSRFLVQWISSERAKKSVMPVAFWWLSITGAAMLLTYGILRQDIVIILGQSFGFLVYARNLWFIREEAKADDLP